MNQRPRFLLIFFTKGAHIFTLVVMTWAIIGTVLTGIFDPTGTVWRWMFGVALGAAIAALLLEALLIRIERE